MALFNVIYNDGSKATITADTFTQGPAGIEFREQRWVRTSPNTRVGKNVLVSFCATGTVQFVSETERIQDGFPSQESLAEDTSEIYRNPYTK